MQLLVTPLTFLEIAIFSLAVVAFLLAVRFFLASQKKFEHLLPEKKKKRSRFGFGMDRDGFIVPTGKEAAKNAPPAIHQSFANDETKNEIKELRGLLQLQQLELTRAVNQITEIKSNKTRADDFEEYAADEEKYKDDLLPSSNIEIDELQYQFDKKEAELIELRLQTGLTHKLQKHFEEVQSGYEELQAKVQKMEQQAWQAAELSITVNSLEQANEHLEKTLLKKEEKGRELELENGRLHNLLTETEDKLSEANLQRQQLKNQVQFLEQINNDIQQMSEANRKLKTELRRVGELESMLNLITEERDVLLHRRTARF